MPPKSKKKSEEALLLKASQKGQLLVVDSLLAVPDIDVNKADNEGNTPLLVASQSGHLPVVERLLAHPGIDVNKKASDYEHTPLFVASKFLHLPVVERLLAVPGIDVNKASDYDESTPLCIASLFGYLPVIERLLAAPGIDVNKANRYGYTPLHNAALRGHLLVVERLLAVPGIDVNKAPTGGQTPLFVASLFGYLPVIERLLAVPGIDVNKASSVGQTPLYIASFNGHLPVVERLLAHPGIDVNKASATGHTPLFVASFNGHLPVLERLLAVPGIDILKKANDGRNALDIAIRKGHAEIVKLIRDALRPHPVGVWRGFSRSDIMLLDSIFVTEPGPGGGPCLAVNASCCPICFKIAPGGYASPQRVNRIEGCMYMMDHNCSTLGGYYHRDLYEKYKDAGGKIVWCTICGRICESHKHRALSLASGPKAAAIIPLAGANVFGGEADCIKYGGGGLKEKLMRYRRMREYALELQDKIGKISFEEAIDKLIEETWNAPLFPHNSIETIAREKKWNIPNTAFLNIRSNNSVVKNVPYPFAGKPAMVPILGPGGINNISYDDVPVLFQLVHRKLDGTIHTHDQKISIQSLFGDGFVKFSAKKVGEFGICMFKGDDGCDGIHYPDELQFILNNYPEEHLPAEKRAEYQGQIDKYKTWFNEMYNEDHGFKARVDADIAAGSALPAGGAGRGGGRRKTHRRHQAKRKTRKI